MNDFLSNFCFKHYFRTAFTIVFLLGCNRSFAQYKLNYGLDKPQDSSTLPKSSAPTVKPRPKPKINSETKLIPCGDGVFTISDGWDLIAGNKIKVPGSVVSKTGLSTLKWFNAVVPGTVLTSLVENGIYPDPYFGLNNLAIPDTLCRQDWWYRTTFKIPDNSFQKNAWLTFEGINYMAEIWLNGKNIGTIKGAFKKGLFNITPYLNRYEANVIAVHILPPLHPGIPHEESPSAGTGPNGGKLALDGPTFISSEGWDWVPGIRDRNIGIWQDVKINFTGDVSISDPQVISRLPLPDTSSAQLTIKAKLINSSDHDQRITLSGNIENIVFTKNYTIGPRESKIIILNQADVPQLLLKHPRLWWPNGYGNPELYTLILKIDDGDTRSVRFGVRELSYELNADFPSGANKRIEYDPSRDIVNGKPVLDNLKRRKLANGDYVPSLQPDTDPARLRILSDTAMSPFLVIRVNGKRIFCRGGNWGMDDAMKNVSREHLEPYFRLHKNAHLNMVRNWTGESTEEVFYDLCDEYGLLVWNDFWLSTQGYNLDVTDNNLFIENAEDVIRRFRNHPSIALWCPRNEGFAPPEIEGALSSAIASEDGTRLYQGNSRLINLRTSGPWNYFIKPADYYTNVSSGFSTELGTPSIPTAASLKKMMAKEDLWPISDVWYYHDLHNGQKDYIRAIDSLYGPSDNLNDFCKKAQMINYESHRAMFESWNSKLWNNTSGLLLWMTHPAWPSTVWQIYSWDYETFGSYFGVQKACEPIHVQMNLNDNKVAVINSTLKTYNNVLATYNIFDLNGKKVAEQKATVKVLPNCLTNVFTPEKLNSKEGYLVRLMLSDSSGLVLSLNDYWKLPEGEKDFGKFNMLQTVSLNAQILQEYPGKSRKLRLNITNSTATPAIGIKLNVKNKLNGEIILPAYFSDGYFNLLPGESRQITVDYTPINAPVEIISEGYNVKSACLIEYASY